MVEVTFVFKYLIGLAVLPGYVPMLLFVELSFVCFLQNNLEAVQSV